MDRDFDFGADIMPRLHELAAISESPEHLTRKYLTDEHRRANDLVQGWMQGAGMAVHQDAVGNIVGRYEGAASGAPALIIGSHLDTVVMAGKYDGMLGIVSGIECVRSLNARNVRLPFAVEVIGFADEEGVRFQSTYLGSRALAGTFDLSLLERPDRDGVTMADAMRTFGLDPAKIHEAQRRPEDVAAYIELHIEQGPALEGRDLAVGAVTAIAGANRLAVVLEGESGHAGTVPMGLRRDALAAASECVLALEEIAAGHKDAVGTVGQLEVSPGASNVIPGSVRFTVDLRAPDDAARRGMLAELQAAYRAIAERRRMALRMETVHEAESVACADGIISQIGQAIEDEGIRPFLLPSGAGHDAAAMAALTDVGMIFVRCRGGISHSPDESITERDALAGARVLLRAIENFAMPG
jgi:allantoate deiminase